MEKDEGGIFVFLPREPYTYICITLGKIKGINVTHC